MTWRANSFGDKRRANTSAVALFTALTLGALVTACKDDPITPEGEQNPADQEVVVLNQGLNSYLVVTSDRAQVGSIIERMWWVFFHEKNAASREKSDRKLAKDREDSNSGRKDTARREHNDLQKRANKKWLSNPDLSKNSAILGGHFFGI